MGFDNSVDEGRGMDPQMEALQGDGQDFCKREQGARRVGIKAFCSPQVGAVGQRRLNFWGVWTFGAPFLTSGSPHSADHLCSTPRPILTPTGCLWVCPTIADIP